jgi:hypothetical protein
MESCFVLINKKSGDIDKDNYDDSRSKRHSNPMLIPVDNWPLGRNKIAKLASIISCKTC